MADSPGRRTFNGAAFISGILLAGGESRRMGGVNKALLEIGGSPIVERTATVLERIFPEVIVVTNTPEEFEFLGLPMFGDLRPGKGSLGGLYTGLKVCRSGHVFLAACDMPFLDERVIRYMANLVEGHDVVVPRIEGRLQPLHAIYSRTCVAPIERLMAGSDLTIINFFDQVDVLEVPESDLRLLDPDLRFVMNINTPHDLEWARTLAQEQA